MATGGSQARRIRKGMSLAQVEQLQESRLPTDAPEYLDHIIARDPHDLEAIVKLPTKSTLAEEAGVAVEASQSNEPLLDQNAWIYESLRHICRDLTSPWLLQLQSVCNRQTCNEMKGGEWLYLCAAHASATETECCAIDYINHTLDAASALLCSRRYFPSRIAVPDSSLKHFTSISRRLYRIFSHAYFHHPELFQDCEAETSLYARFKLLMIEYELVSPEILAVPASYEAQTDEEPAEDPAKVLASRPDDAAPQVTEGTEDPKTTQASSQPETANET